MTGVIHPDEQAELTRLLAGGDYDESFWHGRAQAALQQRPLLVEVAYLKQKISELPPGELPLVLQRLERRLRARLRKVQAEYAKLRWPYCQTAEECRLDNLRSAAVLINRAWKEIPGTWA